VTIATAWLLVRDRTTALQLTGVAVALAGIVYMVVRGDLSVLIGLEFYSGDFWMLLAVVGYANYAVRLRRLPSGLHPMTVIWFVSAFGSLQILPFYIVESIVYKAVPVSWEATGAIGFMAIFASLISVLIWNQAIRRAGVNRAAIFVNLMPVFGAILAIVFLGERLFLFHVVGAALVFAGIVLVVRGDPDAVKRRAEQPAE
jgi:drug/metabolite transporter (DMT)-like permease